MKSSYQPSVQPVWMWQARKAQGLSHNRSRLKSVTLESDLSYLSGLRRAQSQFSTQSPQNALVLG